MLDPSDMHPKGFHPVKIDRSKDFKGKSQQYDRTLRPPRYYLIDFGLSRQYNSRDALDNPVRGGDKSVPEHQLGRRCNPFHTDIYHLGNLVRLRFVKVNASSQSCFSCAAWLIVGPFRDTTVSNLWRT
jgi:hypothetical protein